MLCIIHKNVKICSYVVHGHTYGLLKVGLSQRMSTICYGGPPLEDLEIMISGVDTTPCKNHKPQKEHPTSFAISFKEKKRIIQIGPPEVWVWVACPGLTQ